MLVGIEDRLFADFALLLLAATVVGIVAMLLRQPLIIAFIVVGILVGPTYLGLIGASNGTHEVWELLSVAGISLLLFVVGLRLDINEIRSTGPIALMTGLGQVVFTSGVGFVLALVLGLSPMAALYVAVALTFSSTIIIVKLLSDKREIDSLHGRIAIGFLIVQDIVVVLVMIGLSALGAGTEGDPWREALLVLVRGVGFVGGIVLLMRYVLPAASNRIAHNPELLVLSAITWAMAMAVLAELLGFSKEVGAFLAGVSLASTAVREAVGTRLASLRDFLLLFFFLTLGASLDMSVLTAQILPAIVLSLFVLIGNPIIVMVIMGLMGYRRRTGFLAGLTVAQISEFSLILGALGLSFGHITEETLGLITIVGLVTIGLSTYLILYSHYLYERLAPWLRVFEREVPHREQEADETAPRAVDVIVFGIGRYGGEIALQLHEQGLRVLGIDFDPQAVRERGHQGISVRYGDAEDPEFASTLPLRQARWVIATMREERASLALLDSLKAHGFRGRRAVAAMSGDEVGRLREAGADLVLLPFKDAAVRAAEEVAATFSATQAAR